MWQFYYSTLLLYSICTSLAFDIHDLRQINGSCYSFGVCRKREGFRLDDQFESTLPSCECDDKCIEYGDCCLNAISYDTNKMKDSYKSFSCLKFEQLEFYAKVKCDSSWNNDSHLSELCESATKTSPETLNDPLIQTPVTSLKTNVTYGNYYCALCNKEDIDDVESWDLILSCSDKYNVSQEFIRSRLTYSNNSWGAFINNSKAEEDFISCSISPLPKENINRKIRRCRNLIDSCSPLWNNSRDVNLCETYMNTVYGPPPLNNDDLLTKYYQHVTNKEENIVYKNYHCSVCNFLSASNISCFPRTLRKIFDTPQFSSLSVLFNFGHKKLNCNKGEIWDPFNNKCRRVFCVNGDEIFVEDRCIKTNDQSKLFNSTSADNILKCDKLLLTEKEFVKRANGSIFVRGIERTYSREDYVTEGKGVFICIPRRYSSLMAYLTLFGLGLSCVCIVVHLIVFSVIPDIRNLSGKNLSSFSLALLLAYVCFLIAAFQDTGVDDCVLTASFMYYFFLSSFFWMNVMAFDVWRTLKMATSELRLSAGKQWRKFILYSLYAWCLPLMFLVFVIAVDLTQPSWMPLEVLPQLGSRNCWFRQKYAILLYFALPLFIIMLMNIAFFVLSVRIINVSSARSTDDFQRSHPQKGQLKLYLRLALLMGLSWISGIIAGYIQDERAWFVFILLNAFQGLFILLGFTCTEKVYRAFLSKYPLFQAQKRGRSSEKYKNEHVVQSNDSNQTHLSNTSSNATYSPQSKFELSK